MTKSWMRKIVIAICTAAMLLGTCAPTAFAYECYKKAYVTASDFLAVRTAPDKNATMIGALDYGEVIYVIDTTDYDGWSKVSYNGKKGYVYSKYLSFEKKGGSSSGGSISLTAYVTASDFLAVRVEPDSYSTQVGSLYYGDSVEVIDNSSYGSWTKIWYNGKKRYVYSKYLSYTKPGKKQSSSFKDDYNEASKKKYTVCVDSGYLALRSSASNSGKEIARLYNGTKVRVLNGYGVFWRVEVISTRDEGYVNSNYLE